MANRKQRRQMSRYGIGQEILDQAARPIIDKTKTLAYRLAFGGMMLALHKDFGFGKEELDKLAEQTVLNIQNALSPTELRNELFGLTGFDVDEPIEADRLGLGM